ncbi:MAG TPA: hypothetical protein VMO26_00905 [Vicinamibacterales bacterium]|nr:hypothetical protein [Vicinamibacterales bacterium]
MTEWVQAQVAAGLPAFRGSSFSGTVAVKQELLNELLTGWLAAEAERPVAPAAMPGVSQLLPFVKQAAVRAEPGTVLVDFQISI